MSAGLRSASKRKLVQKEDEEEKVSSRQCKAKKSHVPHNDDRYVLRKDKMNTKFLSLAKQFGILDTLSADTPAIVLDDFSSTDPTKLNTCSFMIDQFGVDAGHIVVTNPSSAVVSAGMSMGVSAHESMLETFLQDSVATGRNFRSPLAVMDFCQSLDTITPTLRQYLANHMVTTQNNLVLVTFSNTRAGTKPTMKILERFNEVFRECIPPTFKLPIVFQQSFDANGKMFQVIFMLEPIETASEILFRDLLLHRTVYARHPLAKQTTRPDIAEQFKRSEWIRGVVEKIQDGQLQVRWKLSDSRCFIRKYPLQGPANLFGGNYDGTFLDPSDRNENGNEKVSESLLHGCVLRKTFGKKMFNGKVTQWRWIDGEDHWRVVYEDGDEEELSYHEILLLVI